MAVLPPVQAPGRGGARQRTQMGDILGFGGGGGGGGRGSPEREKRDIRAKSPPPAGVATPGIPQLAAQPPPGPSPVVANAIPMAPAGHPPKHDTRRLLEDNLAFPRPVPWLPSPPWAVPHLAPMNPAYPPNNVPFAGGLDPQLGVRIASCERKLEAQHEHSEHMQRLIAEVRQLKEGHEAYGRVSDDRIAELERATERGRREETATREALRALQVDFREFSTHAVARQRTEIESEVGQALARQRASSEEWQAALRQQNSQLQGDLSRLGSNIDKVAAQVQATSTELRTRLGALEAAAMAGRSGPPAIAGGVNAGPVTEHLRQQLEALRQNVAQAGAGVVELQARLEGEAAARGAMQRDHDARLAALNHGLKSEREDLHQSMAQRLDVLEARLGVERSDLIARQAELKHEVQSGDELGNAHLQDFASRLRGELDAAERRWQAENGALKDRVDSQFAQIQSARAAEEEARRSSTASLFKRVETSSERQLEAVRGLRQEIDAGLRDAREAVRAENTARVESEQRLLADTGDATRAIASEVAALRSTVQQQADVVNVELDRVRQANAERADSMSRYVDDVVARLAARNGNNSDDGDQSAFARDLRERLTSMRTALDDQAAAQEKRVEQIAEDLRLKLRRVEEARERDASNIRKESERVSAAAERRATTAQEELRGRFEAYVRHFDSAIGSVQAAILRPPRGDVPSNIGSGMAAPVDLGVAEPSSLVHCPAESTAFIAMVDGLRVRMAPDMASDVQTLLSRGDTVVSRGIVADADGRQWLHLLSGSPVASGESLAAGGYVLFKTDSGRSLLDPIEGEEGRRIVETVVAGRNKPPHVFFSNNVAKDVSASDDVAKNVVAAVMGRMGLAGSSDAHGGDIESRANLLQRNESTEAERAFLLSSSNESSVASPLAIASAQAEPVQAKELEVLTPPFMDVHWTCEMCTRINSNASHECAQCGQPRGKQGELAAAESNLPGRDPSFAKQLSRGSDDVPQTIVPGTPPVLNSTVASF